MPNDYITKTDAITALGVGADILQHGETHSPRDKINAIPAADVAPVVRCRDCEQYVAGELGYGKCNFFKTAIFSGFYCRYGGKKGRPE